MCNRWVGRREKGSEIKDKISCVFTRWSDKTERSNIKGEIILFFILPSPDCCLPFLNVCPCFGNLHVHLSFSVGNELPRLPEGCSGGEEGVGTGWLASDTDST